MYTFRGVVYTFGRRRDLLTHNKGSMNRIFLEVVLDVLLRWESRDEYVVESFACLLHGSVGGRTLEVQEVGFAVFVQTLSRERVELIVQLFPFLRRDGVFVLERNNVNDRHCDEMLMMENDGDAEGSKGMPTLREDSVGGLTPCGGYPAFCVLGEINSACRSLEEQTTSKLHIC